MNNRDFGSCCGDLGQAMTNPQTSFFRVEANGVLYLTIGYTNTDQGTAWFDQAVLFCPFCGSELQNRDAIRVAAVDSVS